MNVQWFFALLIFFFISLVGIAAVWSLVREPRDTPVVAEKTQLDRLRDLRTVLEDALDRVDKLEEKEDQPPVPQRKP